MRLSVLYLVALLTLFSRDIYYPVLPQITSSLASHTALITSAATIVFMLDGLSQLISGPLSDRYGRQSIALIGCLILLLGNVLALLASNGIIFFISGLLRGLGTGSFAVISRCIIRDLFGDRQLTKYLATLSMVVPFAPIIAPNLGSVIGALSGWRAVFGLLVMINIVCFVLIYYQFHETNQRSQYTKLSKHHLLAVIRSKVFIMSALLSGALFCFSMVLFILLPFLLQQHFAIHLWGNGFFYALVALSFILGSMTIKQIINSYSEARILWISLAICGFGTIWVAVSLVVFNSLPLFCIAYCITVFGSGVALPVAGKIALNPFESQAGLAAGLLGFIRASFLFLMGTLAGFFAQHIETLIVIYFILCVVIIFFIFSVNANRKLQLDVRVTNES